MKYLASWDGYSIPTQHIVTPAIHVRPDSRLAYSFSGQGGLGGVVGGKLGCTVADMCGCRGRWDDGSRTWDSAGLCGRSEGEDARLRLALLVLGHHVHLVLRVPVQAAQHHVLAVVGDADLGLPVGAVLLQDGRREGHRGNGGKTVKPGEHVVVVLRRGG